MAQTPDPFDALGVEPRFDLDAASVERAYLARIAGAHPDRAGAAADSARLNRARSILLDPERRANALLERLGGPPASADKTLPDGFLAEMMQTRMEIEEALASPTDEARAHWAAWADDRRGESIAAVSAQFAQALAGEAGALPAIRRTLNAWRYIERLIEQLDPAYDPARADFEP